MVAARPVTASLQPAGTDTAAHELVTSRRTIEAIAERFGFCGGPQRRRHVRGAMNVSPEAYRHLHGAAGRT